MVQQLSGAHDSVAFWPATYLSGLEFRSSLASAVFVKWARQLCFPGVIRAAYSSHISDSLLCRRASDPHCPWRAGWGIRASAGWNKQPSRRDFHRTCILKVKIIRQELNNLETPPPPPHPKLNLILSEIMNLIQIIYLFRYWFKIKLKLKNK